MGSDSVTRKSFPKRKKATQCLIPYSENKGYVSNPRRLCELEFNNLNIHLYLRLIYGRASEQLKYGAQNFMVLFDVFVAFVGLNNNNNTIVYAQHRIWIGLVSPIPDPQKMTGSEPIPILSIGFTYAFT